MTAGPGLPLPNLDDRRWADLVDEGRSLIPLYAPEWTDHNLHDPGITLIELFAWAAEQGVFRLDRVGDALARKFLALAGVTPHPPRPARAVFGFNPPAPAAVPAGETVHGFARDGARVPFRTLGATFPVPYGARVFQTEVNGGFVDRTGDLDHGVAVAPFGPDPGPGAAFVLGLGLPHPVPPDKALSLYFEVRDPAESEADRAVLAAGGGPPPHHSVRLVWEARTRTNHWVPLHATDETRGLTLNGRVLLRGEPLAAAVTLGRSADDLTRFRCRIAEGRHDAAPVLRRLVVNGVEVEQAVPRTDELGQGDGGWPDEVRQVPEFPVVASSVRVTTDAGGTTWEPRADFDSSTRTDAHVVVDPTTGTVTFGNGERGRALPDGARPVVRYLATRAAGGNGEIAVPAHPTFGAVTATAAWGGADAEPLARAAGRLRDERAAPDRAVTAADCERLAAGVPGTVVARAAAVPAAHPSLPGVPCPGVVTVTVLPRLPADRPAPTPGLCRAVAEYLNRRGVLGTRVVVTGPRYRAVTVTADLRTAPRAQPDEVRARAAARLAEFFHPLRGGPDGAGWPIGRDVYRAEVVRVLADLPGVQTVAALSLTLDGGEPECGNLCLGPRGLPGPGPHAVAAAPAPAHARTPRSAP